MATNDATANQWLDGGAGSILRICDMLVELDRRNLIPSDMRTALVKHAASQLGDDWDIEILEMHHRHKVDAPSGTALLLGEAAANGRGIDLKANSERGRDGITGARATGAVGFASLRGGSVAGDHSIIFASDNERIELTHRAESRAIFATGAVKAALWLVSRQPQRYHMAEVLGL